MSEDKKDARVSSTLGLQREDPVFNLGDLFEVRLKVAEPERATLARSGFYLDRKTETALFRRKF